MAATRKEVNRWIESAREDLKEYIISVCDRFDYSDYPVYCEDIEDLRTRIPEFDGKNMQKINEIIQVIPDGQIIEGLRPGAFI